MKQVRVWRTINNMEIMCKLMNSVAKRCGCQVKYNRHSGAVVFSGDPTCQKYIIEETLSYFRAA